MFSATHFLGLRKQGIAQSVAQDYVSSLMWKSKRQLNAHNRKVLAISNHPTRLDWCLLWPFFAAMDESQWLKIVMKGEMKN